ncbi:MAG TPA: hypothetical protein VN969_36355 [Streptosporangiaceae bacterium]|nr:hypothetical protein [Streptosporangiaceae bacterium]
MIAQELARSARSSGRISTSAVRLTTRPSAKVIVPSTAVARRRMLRAGVLSRRCAADSASAPRAASTGAIASVPAWAT